MKVIKKPLPMKGVCTTCKAEYEISPKDLRKASSYFGGNRYVKCKFCKQVDVKVFRND